MYPEKNLLTFWTAHHPDLFHDSDYRWGVTTISLIQAELDNAAITDVSGMDVFIQAIPFNYYAILTLFMAGLLAFTQWDYGPMLKAQNRAMKTGKTLREGGVPMRSESASDKEAKKTEKSAPW